MKLVWLVSSQFLQSQAWSERMQLASEPFLHPPSDHPTASKLLLSPSTHASSCPVCLFELSIGSLWRKMAAAET